MKLTLELNDASWERRIAATKSKLSCEDLARSILDPRIAQLESVFPDLEVARNLARIAKASPEMIAKLSGMLADDEAMAEVAAQITASP